MNFWSNWEPSYCVVEKCQCEAARDQFIRQPSSFWSSFAYILAAILIYRNFKHKSLELKLWSTVCVLLGISSLFGHGSYTSVGVAMDFTSIVLTFSFFALLNLLLLLNQSSTRILLIFISYYVLLFYAMYSMNKWAKIGTCVLIFFFSIGDVIREMGPSFIKAKTLQISLMILGVSFVLFILDELHIGCDPYSLFQWHSLWHLGTALSMYYYGKWRFEKV